jgi:hypothetical protein
MKHFFAQFIVTISLSALVALIVARHSAPVAAPTHQTYGAAGGYFLPSGATLGETVAGNDAGAWTPLAAGTNGYVYELVNGVPAWVPAPIGTGLIIPGTITAPPTVAGGGWAVVHSGGSPAIADAPYGVEITVPSNAGAFPTGFGYVRPCVGSPSCSSTMSVEVGAVPINSGASGSFPQFMIWGAEMEENSTGKYISCVMLQSMTSVNEIGTTAIDTNVNTVGTQVLNGNFNTYSQPFIRLRLDGLGHVICEVSADRNRWVTSSGMTFNVTSVFTTGPDHVGIGSNQAEASATTYLSVFDFVTN